MASHPPTPVATPSPGDPPSISNEINIATRKAHTELNRLIIQRLPLALPPHSHDPALLGQGLAAFAKIFFVFEAVWASLEDGKSAPDGGSIGAKRREVLHARLKTLRPVGMVRSQRLAADLKYMEKITGKDWSRHSSSELPIGHGLVAKPHLLLAYAWVMYMAIFSGGRWIRAQLKDAGPEFWKLSTDKVVIDAKSLPNVLETPGLCFLCFDGEEDGEDIKREFKRRLVETEACLTFQERQEVVEEATHLFEHCIALVQQLDAVVLRQRALRIASVAALLGILLAGLGWLYWFDQYGYLER
ncbi:hypothetical protein LTR62_000207 [Meristemomyces frigidus]|uniref:Heme oxygenase-like protein n=1 Tax=Meristemomyces frigidus TaxID=1508187 RepID=A0AAN7TR79_9PEZI|nr:hypothetical protein LTR62_000207 [Meristemomyces frigidus]